MARLTDSQKRFFQRLSGSNIILSLSSCDPEIRKILINQGVSDSVIVKNFDTSTTQDVVNLEVISIRGVYPKRLTFKD